MRAYLDYNATTPAEPAVLDAMLPYLRDNFGNAGSVHSAGQRARAAVDDARESVATLIGAKSSEIVFTSGGTEADNLAIRGTLAALEAGTGKAARPHVITTAVEHHAVLQTCEALAGKAAKKGIDPEIDLIVVPVAASGIVDPDSIRRAIRPETALITVMHANNESGAIQPIEEISRIATRAGVRFHCDAVQSAGKIPVDVRHLGVDLLSLSAHKFYGPKGVGALYVRTGTPLAPLFRGGHAERDRRPGTENVPGIVAIGKAAELARQRLAEDSARIAELRDRLEAAVLAKIPAAQVNGDPARRVPNTSNLTFPGAGGEALLISLDLEGLACSTGAACSSGSTEPSHVLLAMGLQVDDARSTLRFSLGRQTTAEEIDYAIALIPRVVERIRALSPRASQAAAPVGAV
jgi:cysteine desulfurase